MKKIIITFLTLLIPFTASAKLNVVATLPVFASIAQEIGGDRVQTRSLARGNQDPHFLDAKPTFVVALNQADVLIHGGLELEIGWLPPILVQARNPNINPNTPGNVDLSEGLNILEIPQTKVDRSMGDVHPRGNPHTWLDPENVRIMAVNIAEHFSELDGAGKSYYQNQLKKFLEALNEKMIQWNQETAKLKKKNVITYHKSLVYFCHWTGLEVIATVEPKPGIPPSSKHVDDLLDKIASIKVQAIIMESFYPKKVPEYLSEKSKLPLIMIPTDVGEEGIKTYFELIDTIIQKMRKVIS